jgi:hypothetical protein
MASPSYDFGQLGLSQAPEPTAAPEASQSLGLTSPPANVASPEVAQAPSAAPDYSALKSNATDYYLANGGNQANVDAYFAANPGQDYTKLAGDAAQYYAGQNPGDAGNQNIASYFGIAPPAAGQNYNFGGAPAAPAATATPAAPATPGAPSPYPQSWLDTYNAQDPATQAAIQARYGGMTPEQIMADWNANVAPNYATGTTPTQILSGAPPGPAIAPGPQGPAGAPGSMNRAMQSAGTAAPRDTPANLLRHGMEEAAFGAGSGTIYDPWNQVGPNARGQLPAGYTYGPGTPAGPQTFNGQTFNMPAQQGAIVKWDEPKGPQGGFTMAGQQQMNTPITAAGQTFPNFQAFLDFMQKSTPAEQGLKKELETAKNPAGGSLFDALAPYLIPNATTPPMGATPFTDWNPTSLLELLTKSGLLK